jgi:hypothetical protein
MRRLLSLESQHGVRQICCLPGGLDMLRPDDMDPGLNGGKNCRADFKISQAKHHRGGQAPGLRQLTQDLQVLFLPLTLSKARINHQAAGGEQPASGAAHGSVQIRQQAGHGRPEWRQFGPSLGAAARMGDDQRGIVI